MVAVFKAMRVGRMKSENAKPTTVLVVEDEPTVRALAESIIEALGYMILSAANAREAIALLEQDEPIDILFTDINLPDGPDAIDGLELARKAVELCPSLRVIYTTGTSLPKSRSSRPRSGWSPLCACSAAVAMIPKSRSCRKPSVISSTRHPASEHEIGRWSRCKRLSTVPVM